jgi:hypothetical protein
MIMAGVFLSGKFGFVGVTGTNYSFGKWSTPMKVGLPKVTNFNSGGYRVQVVGIFEGQIELEGPWEIGAMPLAVGTEYTFTLGVTAGLSIAIAAIVETITPSNDVEDTPRVKVTAQSQGAFTASIA